MTGPRLVFWKSIRWPRRTTRILDGPHSARDYCYWHEGHGPYCAATKHCASFCIRALDALGRTEEAKALRERYGPAGRGK
jgi:hypothetical protein